MRWQQKRTSCLKAAPLQVGSNSHLWTLSLPLRYQWHSDGTTKDTKSTKKRFSFPSWFHFYLPGAGSRRLMSTLRFTSRNRPVPPPFDESGVYSAQRLGMSLNNFLYLPHGGKDFFLTPRLRGKLSFAGQHRNGKVKQGQFPGHFYFNDSGALVTGPRKASICSTLNTFGTDVAKSSGKSNSLSSQLKSGRPIR